MILFTFRWFYNLMLFSTGVKRWAMIIKKLKRESQGFKNSFLTQKLNLQKKSEEIKERVIRNEQSRVLRPQPTHAIKSESLISSNNDSDDSYSMWGKKRRRKNSDQIKVLENLYLKHPRWDKETVEKAVKKSGLSRSQVYKWGWDQKKKQRQTGFSLDTPSKDEFGGYSKHDFVENDKSISNLLNIDLNLEIQKLELGLEPLDQADEINKEKTKSKISSSLVDTKKRTIKEKAKELGDNLPQIWEKRKFKEENIQNILLKTPNIDRSRVQGFTTPVKESVEKNELPKELRKFNKTLFSEHSITEKDLNSKSERKFTFTSERKLTPSSENSLAKMSKSVINTSDLKCSEVLTPK